MPWTYQHVFTCLCSDKHNQSFIIGLPASVGVVLSLCQERWDTPLHHIISLWLFMYKHTIYYISICTWFCCAMICYVNSNSTHCLCPNMQTDVFLQYCGNSTVLPIELLLFCTKTSIQFILENRQQKLFRLSFVVVWYHQFSMRSYNKFTNIHRVTFILATYW